MLRCVCTIIFILQPIAVCSCFVCDALHMCESVGLYQCIMYTSVYAMYCTCVTHVHVCVCVCVREREREMGEGRGESQVTLLWQFFQFLPRMKCCMVSLIW